MWTYHNPPRIEASPGFLLMLGILFWLDEGVGLLPCGLIACFLHELGHLAAAAVLDGTIKEISFTVIGAELRIDYKKPLTYGQESFVALSGPAANLLFGALAHIMKWHLLEVISLAVGAFNLLPVLPLDGGQVVYARLAARLDPDWAERLMTAVSGCLVGALVGVGVVSAVHYANVTLLLTALWLLAGVLRRGG